MKTICTLSLILCLLGSTGTLAQPKGDSATVTIQLNSVFNKKIDIDSVFVIFDRHDLSGAGVIKQVFYPVDNKVVIDNVPKGKYYVEVYSLGVYEQSFNEITTVSKRKSNKLRFRFNASEEYVPGAAVIPSEKSDLSHLNVTNRRSFKISHTKLIFKNLFIFKNPFKDSKKLKGLMCGNKNR